ncbi:MAG: 6-phosphofructokinase [Nanoarchaeota archaeon]
MGGAKVIAIGQGGGPTPVINSQVAGVLYEAKHSNVRKILGLRNGLEGLLYDCPENIVDITDLNPFSIKTVPGAVLGTTRIKLDKDKDDDKIEIIKKRMHENSIDALIYFGGNDSSYVLQSLGDGFIFVHGAKTIDNDLPCCHHTPGFGSAALFNAKAIRNLALDLFSFKKMVRDMSGKIVYGETSAVIYQVMGRDTGWLAMASAFAKVDEGGTINSSFPPHIVWPAELEFDEERYLNSAENFLMKEGKVFIVVSEGVSKTIDGKKVSLAELCGEVKRDEHGHTDYGRTDKSAAEYLSGLLKKINIRCIQKIKSTQILPQHLQRCYEISLQDSAEAFLVGRESLRAVMDGNHQVSIVLKESNTYSAKPARVPLSEIAGKVRYVPSEYYNGNNITGPTQSFIDEFIPAIGSLEQLPSYFELK